MLKTGKIIIKILLLGTLKTLGEIYRLYATTLMYCYPISNENTVLLILEQDWLRQNTPTFYYCTHNYALGEAGAAVETDTFNIDIADRGHAIVVTLLFGQLNRYSQPRQF